MRRLFKNVIEIRLRNGKKKLKKINVFQRWADGLSSIAFKKTVDF